MEQRDPTQPTPPQDPGPQAGAGQAGVPAPAPGQVAVTDDARQWALFSHLSAIITGFIGPLIIYLVKKDDHPYIADQAREALNFNITAAIAYLVSGLLTLVLIGLLLLPIVFIVWIVLTIIAATKANRGEPYRYPLTIRFVS